LIRPDWDENGSEGQELGVRFDMQLAVIRDIVVAHELSWDPSENNIMVRLPDYVVPGDITTWTAMFLTYFLRRRSPRLPNWQELIIVFLRATGLGSECILRSEDNSNGCTWTEWSLRDGETQRDTVFCEWDSLSKDEWAVHENGRYLLTGFVQYLDDSVNALFRSTVHVDYNWGFLQDGTAIAKQRHQQQGDPNVQGMEFIVFGVYNNDVQRTDGSMLLSSPNWHAEGIAGSVLTVRYEEQKLALTRALESHSLEGYFDQEGIIVTGSKGLDLKIGTSVFAMATLAIHHIDLVKREEYYTLNLVRIEAARQAPLSKYHEWKWVRGSQGLNAHSPASLVTGSGAKPVRFTVFGVVEATDRKGVIRLVRPQWESHNVAGRELGIRFDEQLLTLAHVLEHHGWPADICKNRLILTRAEDEIPAGTAIFATCILAVLEEAEDPTREKYILDVLDIDGMYLEVDTE
ncbi:hypothetical protein B0H13DRAFT_1903163, partial [Mycena leptocephala]